MEKEIISEILRIIGNNPDGCGWYGIEMHCRIPRIEFPENTNIGTFLQRMVDEGIIKVEIIEEKERYFLN